MGGARNFTTTIVANDVVAGALPMQDHWLPLSNLDLLLPALNVHVIFCYKDAADNETEYKHKVSILKKSLGEALVLYYAFAGELVKNSAGEPEILCNNRGVDVTEAIAEVKLCDLNLYNPDECIEGKLVPFKKEGAILSVQVTKLQCGGMVIGCTFDHRVADAYSANMFWVTWAEMASSKLITYHPCFRRSLLNPRRPIEYEACLDDMYVPMSSMMPQNEPKTKDIDPLISRIYYIQAEQLSQIQCLASNCSKDYCNKSCHKSKLQSFSAFLWKLIAMHAYKIGGDVHASRICKMGIVVDGRTRLGEDEGKLISSSLSNYYGNVLSIPFGELKCMNLKEMPLNWIANKVQHFLTPMVRKDHFLDLIDWVEVHRSEPVVAKIYSRGNEDGPAFVVSSGLRFPISKVNFGWGEPNFWSYHFPWGGSCGYVMPMPCSSTNGDWVVYMHLHQSQLNFIEEEAPTLFQPFSLKDQIQIV